MQVASHAQAQLQMNHVCSGRLDRPEPSKTSQSKIGRYSWTEQVSTIGILCDHTAELVVGATTSSRSAGRLLL